MIFSPLKIKDIVLKNQLIDEDAWDMVEEEAKRANVSPLDILFGRKLVEREYFTQLLAKDIGVERINLRKVSIPANILKLVPEKVAIDEAVELAKEFGNDTSSKFVNGVLGTVVDKKDKIKSDRS